MNTRTTLLATGIAAAMTLAACGGSDNTADKATSRGEITIWVTSLPTEQQFGNAMAEAWNAGHPGEKVNVVKVPSGGSVEEVVVASITAGTTPCLVYNTESSSVVQYQKMGGVVALDSFADGASYISARSGSIADQYKSPDGHFYQFPWKENPAMLYYNKKIFAAAGLNADNPPLRTWSEFLQTLRTLKAKGGVQAAVWPPPGNQWYNAWFDFYAFYIADAGKRLVEDGKAQFTDPTGLGIANLWKTIYAEGLASKEKYGGTEPFADGKSAVAIWGNDVLPTFTKQNVDFGIVPMPTQSGKPATQVSSFANEKSIGMFTSCAHQATAWDFLKFTTSQESDEKLLDITRQLPVRQNLATTYATFFGQHPELRPFAQQADRTMGVPLVANGVDMWTKFRKAWTDAVIFGQKPVEQAFTEAADAIEN